MKIDVSVGLTINEDGQLCARTDAPAIGFNSTHVFTRAESRSLAESIIERRPDIDWTGFLAELAQKRAGDETCTK